MEKNTYDIRLRNVIEIFKNSNLFSALNIPRSTAMEWIREGVREVIAHPSLNTTSWVLIEENHTSV